VATFVTDRQKTWTQESQILHLVDKNKPDDEWPVFTLRDVTIWSYDGLHYEDLLLVEKKGPFIVHGHMIIDHHDEKQVAGCKFSLIALSSRH
jgi:hypothetical protein